MSPVSGSLSIETARRAAIHAQGLDVEAPPPGKEGVAQAIERLGYVQIDTISVIERAHHHTIWNRCPDYLPQHLDDLQAVDRRIFEYWAHAISYLPISDYRFYLPRMAQHRSGDRAWLSAWKAEHPHVLESVLDRIRKEGALCSKDFEPPPGTKRGTWWDWKPAKRALEILFWQGDLMISSRESFQKRYDLTERVLPPHVDTILPSTEEAARFHVVRALRAQGVAQRREMERTLSIADRPALRAALNELIAAKEVELWSVSGEKETLYALPGALDLPAPTNPSRAILLSPFDNLIIQRDRMKWLFDFEYTLECYVPPAKRKVGYFVLPLLWEDRLIARLDPKADRKSETLQVKTLLFEPTFTSIKDALPSVAEAVAGFARFNGCTRVTFDRISPTGHKRSLGSMVRKALSDRF